MLTYIVNIAKCIGGMPYVFVFLALAFTVYEMTTWNTSRAASAKGMPRGLRDAA
jgi:hypothetical protein